MRTCSNPVTVVNALSMVDSCTIASSSRDIAEDLCLTVYSVCYYANRFAEGDRVTCGAARVIPAVVAAMATHGAYIGVAAHGCKALGWLAVGNTVNADAIVLSTGGLDQLYTTLAAHAVNLEVQKLACFALYKVSQHAGPAALAGIRGGRAVDLLHAAKRAFPSSTEQYGLHEYADKALVMLMPPIESAPDLPRVMYNYEEGATM